MAKKEESKKEPTEEYAGLGKEVFVFKKEDFDNHSLWHKVSLADDSTVSISSDSATGLQTSKKKPRSFTGTFIQVDDKIARYEAQMLARTVLPVFSKSMLSIPLPHMPFQMRDYYTKLYRNPINFFYNELANRLSYPIQKSQWIPSLFKK